MSTVSQKESTHTPHLYPDRYARQILFPGIGAEGQRKLSQSSVLVVGCGALGSSQAEQLVRAGVGRVVLLDRDLLEASNLQRQCLYDESQVQARMPKALAADQRLRQINSQVTIEAHPIDLCVDNILPLIADVDLIIDGTDNLETRFLLNDACLKLGKPWIYGACVSSYGMTMNIIPQQTPCLRCVFEEIPTPGSLQTCDTAGVIGPIVQIIAGLQITEALKWLVGQHDALRPGLLHVDLWDGRFIPMAMNAPRPDCPACQQHKWEFLDGEQTQRTAVLCGRNTVQVMPPTARKERIDLDQLSRQLADHGTLTSNPFLVRLELAAHTLTVFPDGRALIEGTKDTAEARSLYARYIGS